MKYDALRALEVVHHELTKRRMFAISSAGSHASLDVYRALGCLRRDDYVGCRRMSVRGGAAIRPQCGMSQNQQFDRPSRTRLSMNVEQAERIGVSIVYTNVGEPMCVGQGSTSE